MVWRTKDVGDFVNKTFVSYRVTPSDEEWGPVKEKLNTLGTPTVVLLKSNGEEIDRICGFEGEKDEYLQTIKDYSAGKNTISVFLSRLEKDPESVDFNFKVGKRYVDRWQLDQAHPYLTKVLALDPKDTKGFKAEATYNLAEFELRNNKNVVPMQKFIVNTKDEKFLSQGYSFLAFHYLGQNDKEKAVEIVKEALTRLPDNMNMQAQYASIIFRGRMKSKYPEAAEIAKKLTASDSEQLAQAGYYFLLQHSRATKNTDQMFETYDQAIQKFPDSTMFLEGYAKDVYRKKLSDKYDRAIEMTKKALEIDPKSSSAWDTLGKLYKEKGNLEKAVSAIEKAVEINPENKSYARTLEKFKAEMNQ
ncbi:tetratricopeptide repeat protein [Acidobacteriota bacterium]